MDEKNERHGGNGLTIKWIHLVIALSVYLLTIGAVYATMRGQIEDGLRRVQQLEVETIKAAQFNEFQEDIKRRLQSIEDKLDLENRIRKLH